MSDDNENEPPLNLDIPDHLEYSEEHAWVDRSVDPAIIGITEYAADQLGELVHRARGVLGLARPLPLGLALGHFLVRDRDRQLTRHRVQRDHVTVLQ